MKKKLLLGITASSAIWKVIPLIEQLNEKLDVEIEIIQTNSSTKFINPLMFQTLNRKKVHTDLFEEID
ncbi:MAG: phosphopantothenoylcysteine decarboxylase, partial [Streptococcaceae bacterium]|nr:phosphopantothenoylcysteine decarboxylase [Streptococcaceae bacterium]